MPNKEQEQEQEQEQETKLSRRASTPQKTTRQTQTQIPDGFLPDQSPAAKTAISNAKAAGIDLGIELQMFTLHYQANGEYRSDWQAQFRKWLLHAQQRKADDAKRSNVVQMQPKRKTYEDFLAEQIAKFGRYEGIEATARSAFEHQENQYARAG